MTHADPYLIHGHLAQHMNQRLEIITQTPQHILLMGADGNHSHRCLKTRYPDARFTECDSRQQFLDDAAALRHTSWWSKIQGKHPTQHLWYPDGTLPIPASAADWLWANLSLLTSNNLRQTLKHWSHALKNDGFLFFSHLGINSATELHQALTQMCAAVPSPTLVDMHDLGDQLLQEGFYDPITDTAQLVLQYQDFQVFWQDICVLGLCKLWGLDALDTAKAHFLALWKQGLGRTLTLETLFGHALKRAPIPNNHTHPIHFHPPQSR